MHNNKSFYKGAAWLGISMLILKILGLLYKVPLSYMLDDEGMGYFNSAYTVYMFFFMISTAGIPKAISILTAKYEAECKNSSYEIYFSVSKIFKALGLILTVIILIFAKSITSFLSADLSFLSLCAIAPSIFFVCSSGVIRGYLSGHSSFSQIAISELISGVGKLFFGLILAYAAYNADLAVHYISALTILGITLGSAFSHAYLLHSLKKSGYKTLKNHARSYKILKKVLTVSVPITLSSALVSVSSLLDLTIIMKGLKGAGYSELTATVLYGNYTTLALPLFTVVTTIISAICTATVPSLSSAYVLKDTDSFRSHARNAQNLALFIAIPCSVIYFFFSKEVLYMIFDESSASLGFAFLSVLSPALIILAPLSVINSTLEATEKTGCVLVSLSIGTVVKLIINSLFISNNNIGILSAPISTVASYTVSLFISFLFLKHRLGVKLFSMYSCLKIMVSSFLSLALTDILRNLFITTDAVRLNSFLTLLIFGAFYILLSAILSKESQIFLTNCVKINKKKQKRL